MKSNTTSQPSKQDVIRALALSPSGEKVILYESGKAYDISLKLRDMRSQNVTVLVIK